VFVALVIQNAEPMRPIELSSVTCQVLSYFSALFHKRYDVRKKEVIENKISFDILYNVYPTTSQFEKNSAR
jgi:hypothetical protein